MDTPKLNEKRRIKKEIWDRTHNSTAIKKIREGNSQERQINPPASEMRDLLLGGKKINIKELQIEGI